MEGWRLPVPLARRLMALAAVLQSVTVTAFITSPAPVLRAARLQNKIPLFGRRSPQVGSAALRMLAARPKIAFIQTGGTIDKDYPRSTLGYAFEIADAATERIIADASHVPLGVDVCFHTACRKVRPLLAPTCWRRRPFCSCAASTNGLRLGSLADGVVIVGTCRTALNSRRRTGANSPICAAKCLRTKSLSRTAPIR
jgi:hypothetical protein